MKKIIIWLLITCCFLLTLKSKENITIPEDSIRFRIIADSNNAADQAMKMKIKDEINKELFKKVSKAKNKNEAREIINSTKEELDKAMNKYNINYEIKYGKNYFPQKEYKGVVYKEGMYESLVITIGEAKGNNWWCVLYPPLCTLEQDSNNYSENEYKFYIEEIFKKYIA